MFLRKAERAYFTQRTRIGQDRPERKDIFGNNISTTNCNILTLKVGGKVFKKNANHSIKLAGCD